MLSLRSSLSAMICSTVLLSPTMAFANPPARPGGEAEAEAAEAPAATEAQAGASAEAAKADTTTTESSSSNVQIADGRPIEMNELGFRITPPQGWEVLSGSQLSLILQEPKAPVEFDK